MIVTICVFALLVLKVEEMYGKKIRNYIERKKINERSL